MNGSPQNDAGAIEEKNRMQSNVTCLKGGMLVSSYAALTVSTSVTGIMLLTGSMQD